MFGIHVQILGNQPSRYLQRGILEGSSHLDLKDCTPDLVIKPDKEGISVAYFDVIKPVLSQLISIHPQIAVIHFENPNKPRSLIASPNRDKLIHTTLEKLLLIEKQNNRISGYNFERSSYRYE